MEYGSEEFWLSDQEIEWFELNVERGVVVVIVGLAWLNQQDGS